MKTIPIATSLLLCIARMLGAQQAPDGLQFNVPYLCQDGHTYVVHRCEKGPKFEACFYQSGQDSERYNTREAVVYQMTKMCKVQGSPSTVSSPAQQSASTQQSSSAAQPSAAQPSSELNNSRWECGGGTTMTVIGCQKHAGQDGCFVRLEQDGKLVAEAPKRFNEIQSHVSTCKALPALNPAYLAEFPNPYRVVQGMLVGKPQDNVVRAIGAFYQLSEIIRALAGARALTPDEQKFVGDYSRAQSELVQAAGKRFPGQQFDPASNPYRIRRTDPKFGFEGIPVWTTFLTPGTQDAFARMVGGRDDQYAMAVYREKRTATQKVDNDIKAAAAEANYAKDPGSVAVRHCVESGRSEMECLGEGLKVGAEDLLGGNPLKGIVPETPVGLRLTGVYAASGFGLQFQQDHVIVGCGTLIPQPLPYTVRHSGLQISVSVAISPKPLLLSYRDGKLLGPGPIDVAGRVVIGGGVDHASTSYEMQTQTTTTQRQIDAADVPNYGTGEVHQNGMEYSVDQQTTSTNWAPTTQHHYEVPTAPKTEHCNVATLPPTSANATISGALTQVLGSKGSKSANTTPGLRLNGTYAAPGGLKIEFRDDSATLECGESFNSEAYTLVPDGGQLVIKFQNSTGPLSLVLQPNGSLTGSGDIEVAGRRAVQGEGGAMEYLPRTAHCALGTFTASR
jgi:hypothetical protein